MDYSIYPGDEEVPGQGIVLKKARKAQSPGGVLSNTVQPGGDTMLPNARRARLRQLQEQAAALDSAEPDITALQDYAKQQSQAGDAAMLNALAAQYAGESFQPVQTQFLRRAAAARDPMKIGGGMLTPDGQFIRDPFAARERQLSRLDRLIGAEQDDITAEERIAQARLDRLDREAENRRRDQRDYEFRVDAQRDRNANAQAIRFATDGNQFFTRASNLRNEYNKKADKIGEGTRHAETVMTLLTDPTIARDPTKQVSLVFAFGKMLDPESVVRESEYALIANARGTFEGLEQMPERIRSGARLTPSQLKSMQQVAQQLYAGSSQRRQDLADYYADIAARNRLNVDDILPPGSRRGGAAPAAPGKAAAPPAPTGIDQAVWNAMTPEERALWK